MQADALVEAERMWRSEGGGKCMKCRRYVICICTRKQNSGLCESLGAVSLIAKKLFTNDTLIHNRAYGHLDANFICLRVYRKDSSLCLGPVVEAQLYSTCVF